MGDEARAWLNLQVSFGLAGGATWLVGAIFEQDFVSGVGAGLIVAALLLRIRRRGAERGESYSAGPVAPGDD